MNSETIDPDAPIPFEIVDPDAPVPFALVKEEQTPLVAARGMLLHCGAELVTRQDLTKVRTPRNTDTHYPLPHHDLLDEVASHLDGPGFRIAAESHALSHEGARYFGCLEVSFPEREGGDGYGWVVGLRNSHDRSFSAGLVAGSHVLCCDNLAFTGEVRISRKHTKFAVRDLRHLTARAVGQLGDRFRQLDERIGAYREKALTDPKAHDLVIRAIDCRAITPTQVPQVLQEWRKPSHEEFTGRNAWSLFNACTEAHKGINPNTMIARSQALHGLFDGLVGIN